MKIAMGCAKCAFDLKEGVKAHLLSLGHEILDFSTDRDAVWSYPEPFHHGAKAIQNGDAEIGVFLCGTGTGASITANKHAGIYATVAESVYSAQRCKAINNANVLCIGNFIVGEAMAIDMVDAYLNAEFSVAPGLDKKSLEASLDLLYGYEKENMK